MSDELCDGKQKHTYAVAKKISNSNRRNGKTTLPYKCKMCEHWHVASALTGDLKRVKRLKYR